MTDRDQVSLVTADLRLIGGLNKHFFKLLAAIERAGSINKAANIVGLTYKGAWEMIECRAGRTTALSLPDNTVVRQ